MSIALWMLGVEKRYEEYADSGRVCWGRVEKRGFNAEGAEESAQRTQRRVGT